MLQGVKFMILVYFKTCLSLSSVYIVRRLQDTDLMFFFMCPSRVIDVRNISHITTQVVIVLWIMNRRRLCLLTMLFRQISIDRYRFTPNVCIEIAWRLLVIAICSYCGRMCYFGKLKLVGQCFGGCATSYPGR